VSADDPVACLAHADDLGRTDDGSATGQLVAAVSRELADRQA